MPKQKQKQKYKITRHHERRARKYKKSGGILPFIILSGVITGFIWLAGYSIEDQHREDDRVAAAIIATMPPIEPVKLSFRQRQAAALKEAYSLTDADVAAPVILW